MAIILRPERYPGSNAHACFHGGGKDAYHQFPSIAVIIPCAGTHISELWSFRRLPGVLDQIMDFSKRQNRLAIHAP